MRAKACQVTEFLVSGEFAHVSFIVVIVIWDKVVNQVLFLLSF